MTGTPIDDVLSSCGDLSYMVARPAPPAGVAVLWCDPQTVLAAASQPETTESCQLAVIAVQNATWLVDTLTGHQYAPAGIYRDVYALTDPCRLGLWSHARVCKITAVERLHQCGAESDPPATSTCPGGTGEPVGWCPGARAGVVDLCPGTCGPGYQLQSFRSVGDTFGYTDFPLYSSMGQFGAPCGCDPNLVRVSYESCNDLIPSAVTAVCRLATEVFKSASGLPCKLPERITSITRQGVSWTLLDPQDFLERGLVGINQVDQFVAAARVDRPQVSIVDPLLGRLVCSEYLGPVPVANPTPP